MKNIKNFLAMILVAAFIWHGKVWFSTNEKLVGLFQEQSKPGYLWKNTSTAESRFFWQPTKASWTGGIKHPEYNVVTVDNMEGHWTPLPGYVFLIDQFTSWKTEKDGLSTMWKSGLKHPDMNAYSTSDEGKWTPAIGYKFIMENGLAAGTIWDAGHKYDDMKITAGDQQDTYHAYPGYLFRSPETSFDVVWTPGLINPDNSSYTAGATEGSWEYNDHSTINTEPTAGERFGRYIAGHAVATLMENLFGSNNSSDKLREESSIEGIKGAIQVLK